MKPRLLTSFLSVLCVCWGLSSAMASVVSPVQSTSDPLNLPVAGLVQTAGSDAASAAFQSSLPAIQALVKSTLPEYRALSAAKLSSLAVNFSQLYLTADSTVRVYFISEGAAYRSSLGVNYLTGYSSLPTASTAKVTSSAELVFPDASSNDPTSYYSSGNSVRTSTAPLLAGDFVDLGTVSSGTLLDFFLIASGATGGTTTLTAEASRNSDALQHVVALVYGNYLILSFEDATNGGDKDYNDVVLAVEITSVVQTPEPGAWAGLLVVGGLSGLGGWRKWLRRKAAPLAA
ncbi:MAG: DUF4114 domain-containing protein [Chthoniobacteraceae bacterium]